MPSIAASKTPSRSTAMSCVLLHSVQVDVEEEGPAGLEIAQLLADEHAVGAEDDDLLALQDLGDELAESRDRSSARRRRSRRPGRRTHRRQPGIRRSTSFCLIVDSYSRIRPQPVHVRLQACSGSSIRTIGNFLVPAVACGRRSRRFEWSSAEGIALSSSLLAEQSDFAQIQREGAAPGSRQASRGAWPGEAPLAGGRLIAGDRHEWEVDSIIDGSEGRTPGETRSR